MQTLYNPSPTVQRSPVRVPVDGCEGLDFRVLNELRFRAALLRGVVGVLDAYVEGWWDSEQLDELTARILRSHPNFLGFPTMSRLWLAVRSKLSNRRNRASCALATRHYDLGNDLFRAMLDRRLNYSCAYWTGALNLDEAQEAKLDLICRKLNLQPGMRVLDIGCGWGGFARYAAEKYCVSVVGLTVSREQYELGLSICAGLPVELRLQDYREIDDELFDAVVSIGMFEHVGYKNYRTYMEVVRRCLKPDGLCLLHTIGRNTSTTCVEPWFDRYIFPDGVLPSARQIAAAAEGTLIIEDWHNFGADYDKTLMAWHENFENAWPLLRKKYGERFRRMWKCYLLTSAGAFRARAIQLWQLVLSPSGVAGGYSSVR